MMNDKYKIVTYSEIIVETIKRLLNEIIRIMIIIHINAYLKLRKSIKISRNKFCSSI